RPLGGGPLGAALEAGRRPLGRAGNEGAVGGDIREAGRGGQYLQHLQGVGLPVGGEPQQAAPGEAAREKLGERALKETALVVALLRPRVREVDQEVNNRLSSDLPLGYSARMTRNTEDLSEMVVHA